MSRLYAILAGIGGIIAAIFAAFAMGGRSAANKQDAADAKAEIDTYQKSTEAQDALEHSSDDDITRWLHDRAER